MCSCRIFPRLWCGAHVTEAGGVLLAFRHVYTVGVVLVDGGGWTRQQPAAAAASANTCTEFCIWTCVALSLTHSLLVCNSSWPRRRAAAAGGGQRFAAGVVAMCCCARGCWAAPATDTYTCTPPLLCTDNDVIWSCSNLPTSYKLAINTSLKSLLVRVQNNPEQPIFVVEPLSSRCIIFKISWGLSLSVETMTTYVIHHFHAFFSDTFFKQNSADPAKRP